MMLEIVQVTSVNSPDFPEAFQIYLDSFPPSERQPEDIIQERLANQIYQWFVAKVDEKVVAIALLYDLKGTDFILLDYLGTDKKYQGRGIGTELMNHIIKLAIASQKTLVIEVEHPDSDENAEEKRRRVKFYQRIGAKILNNVRYLLPPLSGELPTEMLLMVVPEYPGGKLSGSLVKQLIQQLYLEVYRRDEGDRLLNSFIHEIPELVELI